MIKECHNNVIFLSLQKGVIYLYKTGDKMKKILRISIVAAMMIGASSVSVQADGLSITDNVYVKGEIRPRYEMVDDDNSVSNANALTNRLVIGAGADLFGTSWMSAYAEMTNVSLLNDNYRDLATNNANANSVVADAKQTRLTQSYIDFKTGKTKLRFGRQLMNLDNQRFVGAVGWRQMPQTYDAITLTNNDIKGLNLFASYISQVNTIFADGGPKVDSYDTRTLLFNASYAMMPELKVTAYAYLIGSVHDTYGLSLTGNVPVNSSLKINYRAEYATQDDASLDKSDGPDNVKANADWYNINVGMNMNGVIAAVGYESLSGIQGAGDTAFSTPLATLHGKNGWADKFLSTPAAGLEDFTVMLGYKSKGYGLFKAVYHDFQSEVGNTDYGREIDAVYKNKIPGVKNLGGLLKVASYSADTNNGIGGLNTDTVKFWAMLDYKFSTK